MRQNLAVCLLYCFSACAGFVVAQPVQKQIVFENEPKHVFAFTKKWSYPWYVIKLADGKFSNVEGDKITSNDTAHLYFTASCKTSVQGGYKVRYCKAVKKGDNININFQDGLPAHGSDFDLHIAKNKFVFKPNIISPELSLGEKKTCKVTRSKLILYQRNYLSLAVVSGFIDAEFIETTKATNHKAESHKYYFRGYFKTPRSRQLINNL